MIYCFTESARLYTFNRGLIAQALEMRVFGYSLASNNEIDSFINFLTTANVRTKLFHVGMRPSYLLMTSFIIMVCLVVLLQSGVVSIGTLSI